MRPCNSAILAITVGKNRGSVWSADKYTDVPLSAAFMVCRYFFLNFGFDSIGRERISLQLFQRGSHPRWCVLFLEQEFLKLSVKRWMSQVRPLLSLIHLRRNKFGDQVSSRAVMKTQILNGVFRSQMLLMQFTHPSTHWSPPKCLFGTWSTSDFCVVLEVAAWPASQSTVVVQDVTGLVINQG